MAYKGSAKDRATRAAYYHKNREHILAHQAEYREQNKDKINAKMRGYYQKNKERIIAYRENNREKIAARNAEYRRENEELNRVRCANGRQNLRNRFNDRYGLLKEGHLHGVCTCCKEADLTLFGTISHIDGSGGEHRKEKSNYAMLLEAIAVYNPTKFAAECFNCNMAARRNGGICPHKTGKMV